MSKTSVAFQLRPEVDKAEGPFAGVVSLPDGTAYDVAKALKEGNGKIELDPIPAGLPEYPQEPPPPGSAEDKKLQKEIRRAAEDARLVEALDGYFGVQRVPEPPPKAPEPPKAAEKTSKAKSKAEAGGKEKSS